MKILLFLFCIVLSLFSCKNKAQNKTTSPILNKMEHEQTKKNENKHWTYMGETGPEHWSEIESESESECDGAQQSPINILDVNVINADSATQINVYYSANTKIRGLNNNGHSIQYNFEKGDFVILHNVKYELIQIHFHEPSEYTINGIRYPLEMHLVHISKENKIVVLAVMAKEGTSSKPFTFLEKYLPVTVGETKLIDTNFDLNETLPTDKSYYTYSGSLTTPPCTQGVTWLVYKEPITISLEQVKQLQELMPLNNYRNEQPLNGRIVRQYDGH